jgi:TetR/AcrR family transcriptional regulator, lmrAB and yxaGH operons repressor
MAKHGETRERLLRTAATLFHTQGYHATGLNQVVAEGGAPKGSLYFHFPGGKEQLAAESIAVSAAGVRDLLRSVSDVDDALALFAARLADTDFRDGCPVATVALDAAGESEPIRAACATAYDSWREVLVDSLVRQGVPAARAPGLATTVLAAVEGALLLARTQRDVAPLRQVGADVRLLIEGAK